MYYFVFYVVYCICFLNGVLCYVWIYAVLRSQRHISTEVDNKVNRIKSPQKQLLSPHMSPHTVHHKIYLRLLWFGLFDGWGTQPEVGVHLPLNLWPWQRELGHVHLEACVWTKHFMLQWLTSSAFSCTRLRSSSSVLNFCSRRDIFI